jgi:hypothetical protein
MATQLITTASQFGGGVAAVASVAQVTRFTFGGSWIADDKYTVGLVFNENGQFETLGAGYLTGQFPTVGLTYKKKNYLTGDSAFFYFSAINRPTVFNELKAAGNGFMDLSSEYGFSDDILAAAIYQGKLAVLARRSIQVVAVDPAPANYSVPQTLENIGTVNGDSVRSIGDTDVLFCSDSGVRSLRVRDSSGNLTPADLGTPIDSLIQARLLSEGVSQMASIVEPISNRYWLAVGDLIYVFSYFPSSGITAWSTYDPTIPFAATSANYSAGFATQWQAFFTGLTVGRRYSITRGAKEIAAGATFTFVSGSTNITGEDGSFIADATTATVDIVQDTNPGATTFIFAEFFTPEKFVERAGQVYVRSTDGKIYLYGGTSNATYDTSVCSWETPWLDARSAATKKLGSGMDVGLEGGWALSFGMDATSGVLKEIYRSSDSSFGKGVIPSTMSGAFFKVRGVTTGAEYARFSTFAFHFNGGDAR